MKNIYLKLLFSILLLSILSCRGNITSPSESSNSENIENGVNMPELSEEAKEYGLEINKATSENIKKALQRYYKDKKEYKVIFIGVSTIKYDATRPGAVNNLGAIIEKIEDIKNITVSFENVGFKDNKIPNYILGGPQSRNNNINKVILPDYITHIGDYAFSSCFFLAEINVPKQLVSVGELIIDSTRITSFPLPDTFTTINDYAFRSSTIVDIVIPDSVTYIGKNAFEGCYALKSIVLPKNLTTINPNTFTGCQSLKNITIPASVIKIDSSAFYQANGLETIEFLGKDPSKITVLGRNTFRGTSLTTIYIPNDALGTEEDWKQLVSSMPNYQNVKVVRK